MTTAGPGRNSRRRSAGRAELPPKPAKSAEQFVFFIDRGLGRHDVASALRNLGCCVELHDDHFPPTTPDVVWLAEVGARGWVLLTKDFAISKNGLERLRLFESGVRAFLLSDQSLTGAEMADSFSTALRRMRHISRDERPPFIARVTPAGNVTVLTALKREWRRRTRPRGPRAGQ